MSIPGTYCKALSIHQVRSFAGWQEPEGRQLADEDIVFLQENYTLTDNLYVDEGIIFDDITSEWRTFCIQALGFQPPTY